MVRRDFARKIINVKETAGTNPRHRRFRERLQFSAREDRCAHCGERADRDVSVAINRPGNGRTWPLRSKGPPAEVVSRNLEMQHAPPVIPGVDGRKHRNSFGAE